MVNGRLFYPDSNNKIRPALVLRASLCAFILVFDYQLVAIAGVCFFDISVVVYTLFYFYVHRSVLVSASTDGLLSLV